MILTRERFRNIHIEEGNVVTLALNKLIHYQNHCEEFEAKGKICKHTDIYMFLLVGLARQLLTIICTCTAQRRETVSSDIQIQIFPSPKQRDL